MNKEYLQPGDTVLLNKDINNKPLMYIVSKETDNGQLIGFRCRWFDKSSRLCEEIFSTKDLIKI